MLSEQKMDKKRGRLAAAADYVREGAVFADIGTDHGKLPLLLFGRGRICRAVLTDINEKPLASAVETLTRAGYSGRCEFLQADGLQGLENTGITDIAICGMGGELIVRIISQSVLAHDGKIRFILQPMSRARELRSYLWDNGFTIGADKLVRENGRLFECLYAQYTGLREEYTAAEAMLGKLNIAAGGDELTELALRCLEHEKRVADGAARRGCDSAEAMTAVRELEAVIAHNKDNGR